MNLIRRHQVPPLAPGEVMPACLPRSDFVDAVCLYCNRPGRLSAAQVGQALACPRCRRFQVFAAAPLPRPAFPSES